MRNIISYTYLTVPRGLCVVVRSFEKRVMESSDFLSVSGRRHYQQTINNIIVRNRESEDGLTEFLSLVTNRHKSAYKLRLLSTCDIRLRRTAVHVNQKGGLYEDETHPEKIPFAIHEYPESAKTSIDT